MILTVFCNDWAFKMIMGGPPANCLKLLYSVFLVSYIIDVNKMTVAEQKLT